MNGIIEWVNVCTRMLHVGISDTIMRAERVLRVYKSKDSTSSDPPGTKAEKVVVGHYNTLEVRP